MRGHLGPYEILAPIGSGGMGEVYRARDRRLDRLVAIKVIKTAHHDDSRARERFDREAKVVASLDHPHICALYDVGHDEGVAYLVMQYLEGETLAKRLHNGPLPIADALKYGSQIAHAIDAAHKRGIIHRDLKPSNVMLTKMGAVLLDFGLAKLSDAPDVSDPATTVDLTRDGALVGTVRYMAPEVLERHGTDARSDLFSFGAILYEMVTGRRAFDGDSDVRAMVSILNDTAEAFACVARRTYRRNCSRLSTAASPRIQRTGGKPRAMSRARSMRSRRATPRRRCRFRRGHCASIVRNRAGSRPP